MSKAKAITNEISSNTSIQIKLFKILIWTLFSLFIVYIYLIGSITFNVIARKSLETSYKITSSNIGQLELSYLNKVNDLNKLYATNMGLEDSKSNIFVSRSVNKFAIR